MPDVKRWLANVKRNTPLDITRVLNLGDLHCGHKVGFTPPDFDSLPGSGYGSLEYALYQHRREIYDWITPKVVTLSPDIVLLNGDLIDGKGPKSGGTELLTTDRGEQTDMAVAAIEDLCPHNPEMLATFGTPYHAGNWEDWEKEVVKKSHKGGKPGIKKIGAEDEICIHGQVINYKHHASRSSIPHGRGTPLAKERLWNVMWAVREEYPLAHVILRNHNHYFAYIGEMDWIAMACPGLQGYGTKYGSRRVLGTVDVGFVWFDIHKDGRIFWDKQIMRFRRKAKFALVVE